MGNKIQESIVIAGLVIHLGIICAYLINKHIELAFYLSSA